VYLELLKEHSLKVSLATLADCVMPDTRAVYVIFERAGGAERCKALLAGSEEHWEMRRLEKAMCYSGKPSGAREFCDHMDRIFEEPDRARSGALWARTGVMRKCLWRRNTDGEVKVFLRYIAVGTGHGCPRNQKPF
jgi:hypothetical protein